METIGNLEPLEQGRETISHARIGRVFMFAGQGTQYVGMGKKLHDDYPRVREIFQLAGDLSRKDIAGICFKGPIAELVAADTVQVALTTVNIAFFELLKSRMEPSQAGNVYLGHSLGEYAALYASGVLSLEDTMTAVVHRGAVMLSASRNIRGCMYAIKGIGREEIQGVIDNAGLRKHVSLACDNSPCEQVISGEEKVSKELIKHLLASGKIFRFTRLPVSGAWHSPLMRLCTREFRHRIEDIVFHRPHSPIIMNYSGCAEYGQSTIRENMVSQIYSPVRWRESIMNLLQCGHDNYCEIGPKRTLSVFLSEIAAEKHRYTYEHAFMAR